MKTVRVVAAILHHESRILATQRGYGDFKDGWEFPGGKIEAGESPEAAIVREIEKEVVTVEYDYPTFHLSMTCFWASIKAGEKVALLEHEAAKWLSYEELDSVAWLPADVDVVKAIKAQWVELQK